MPSGDSAAIRIALFCFDIIRKNFHFNRWAFAYSNTCFPNQAHTYLQTLRNCNGQLRLHITYNCTDKGAACLETNVHTASIPRHDCQFSNENNNFALQAAHSAVMQCMLGICQQQHGDASRRDGKARRSLSLQINTINLAYWVRLRQAGKAPI